MKCLACKYFGVLFGALFFVGAIGAQTGGDLVRLSVTVTDEFYAVLPVKLNKENFRIFENKQEQGIQYFSTEDTPVSIGILLDASASMAPKVEAARQAAIEFLRASNLLDEAFMIAFSDRPKIVFDLAPLIDIGEIPHFEAKKHTALLDAVYFGLEKIQSAHYERKVLIIVSDGGENLSHYNEKEIKALLKETEAQIYALCIPDHGPPTPEEMRGPDLLSKITDPTGGTTFCAENTTDLFNRAQMLGAALRNQYVLGYHPRNTARDGHWRKIEVKLVNTKGTKAKHVCARAGYYAPTPVATKAAKDSH